MSSIRGKAVEQKEYKIEFFQLTVSPTDEITSISDIFNSIIDNKIDSTKIERSFTRDIWELKKRTTGKYRGSFTGVFRKFRNRDIPEKGAAGRDSQPIILEPDEGIVEKNFFVYYPKNNLLAWHNNPHASSPKQFANILKKISKVNVNLSMIIQANAAQRLMKNELTMKKVVVSIARPKSADFYPDDDFSRQALALMNGINGDSLHFEIGINSRLEDSANTLLSRIKTSLVYFVGAGATTSKAVVFEDGVEYTIDLIADRVISFQSIETNAIFPPSVTMFKLIDDAKQEKQKELDDYFGTLENTLT